VIPLTEVQEERLAGMLAFRAWHLSSQSGRTFTVNSRDHGSKKAQRITTPTSANSFSGTLPFTAISVNPGRESVSTEADVGLTWEATGWGSRIGRTYA
jgi:hypothetical protein